MGFLSTIGSLLGTGKTPEELQSESDDLDARQREVEAAYQRRQQAKLDAAYDDGSVSDEDAARIQAQLEARNAIANRQIAADDLVGVEHQLDQSVEEGLQEGQKNVSGFFGGVFDVLGKGIGSVLAGIPWWLWLLALGGLLVYLGAPAWVKRRVTA